MTITTSEWLKAFEKASRGAEGQSSADLAALWSVSKNVALRRIQLLVSSGRAYFAGYKTGTTITGLKHQVPVYRMKGKP